MMKTGKDLGIFGGLLAVILGYFVISVGLSLIQYGSYPPPPGMLEIGDFEPKPLGATGIYIIVASAACIIGGVLGIAAGCLANRTPGRAGTLMVAAGCLTAFTLVGMISSAVLATGSMRAFRFADAPPGTEPEWADGEALPY